MREVVNGASVAFALKVIAAGLAFTFNVVLTRLLGAEDAGLYFLALTCVAIAAVVGRAGLDNTIIRFIAASAAVQDWISVKGMYSKGIKFVLIGSSITAGLLALAAPWLAETVFSEPELTGLIRWMAIAVVPFALFTIHSQALQGLKRIRDAVSVLSILPVFSLLGVIVLVPEWGVQGAVWSYTLASCITLMIGFWLWRKATPQLRSLQGRFKTKKVLQSSVPLFWMSLLNLVITRSANLMLGIWAGSAEVAIYSVANRTAMLTSFILVAVNSIAAPKFAALYRQGDIENLGHTARNCAKLMTLMASPVLLVFILVPAYVMELFGAEFSAGAMVLTILAIGQFVNVVTGSVGYLLIMCGHERIMRNIIALCSVINLGLNLTLIPYLGASGAAIATAITLSLQNLIAAGLVWWKLGIMTIPIGWDKVRGRV